MRSKQTDAYFDELRNTTGQRQTYKVDNNLFLFLEPSGAKNWYVRYTDSNTHRQRSYKIGIFDLRSNKHISVREARRIAMNTCHGVDEGESPEQVNAKFCDVAEEWLEKYRKQASAGTIKSVDNRYALYVERAPFYEKGIRSIKRVEISKLLDGLTDRPQTTRKVHSLYNMIFDYARGYGYIDTESPVPKFKYVYSQLIEEKNRAAVTEDPERFGEIVARIKLKYYSGNNYNCAGLLLFLAYAFTRPAEARKLQWRHVIWKDQIIKLSSHEVKNKCVLEIPLTRQLIELLEKQKTRRIDSRQPNDYIFYSPRRGVKFPLSDAMPTLELTQLGIERNEQSAHGFRSCASTYLREYLNYPDDLIEMQLNHKLGTKVSRSYNKAKKLAERKNMLQAWCDWVDKQSDTAFKNLIVDNN